MSYPAWILKLPLNFIVEAAQKHSIPWQVLAALVSVESNGNPNALRYEPGYQWVVNPAQHANSLSVTRSTELMLQQSSIGLGQIMGANVRDMGFNGHLAELFDPKLNLEYTSRFLKTLYTRHSDDMDVISAYNQGSPRKTKGGFYRNQTYVDKVYDRLLDMGYFVERPLT